MSIGTARSQRLPSSTQTRTPSEPTSCEAFVPAAMSMHPARRVLENSPSLPRIEPGTYGAAHPTARIERKTGRTNLTKHGACRIVRGVFAPRWAARRGTRWGCMSQNDGAERRLRPANSSFVNSLVLCLSPSFQPAVSLPPSRAAPSTKMRAQSQPLRVSARRPRPSPARPLVPSPCRPRRRTGTSLSCGQSSCRPG